MSKAQNLESEILFFCYIIFFLTYSSVPNRCACMFINFEEKIPPARPYLALHVYFSAFIRVFALHVY